MKENYFQMLKYLILFCIPYIVYTINVIMQVNNVLSFRKHNRYGSKLSYMEMPKSWPFTVPNCNVLVWMGVDSILKVLLLKGYYFQSYYWFIKVKARPIYWAKSSTFSKTFTIVNNCQTIKAIHYVCNISS